MKNYFTVTQVAEMYGCTRQYIHNLIKEGKLKKIRYGNQFLIHFKEVNKLMKGKSK